MKILTDLAQNIQKLNKKTFDKYLLIFLISILATIILCQFYIYQKTSGLIFHIKNLKKSIEKTSYILSQNDKIQVKEQQLQKLLENNKDFNIRTYFEQFCGQLNITPEPNWGVNILTGEETEKFSEITLTATFKNQTTQKLVTILDELNKKEIVYVKALSIKNEGNRTISFEITLATKKLKIF